MPRIIIYQIGVDILGFPIYVQHEVYQDRPTETKKEPKKQWLKVIETVIKQH